MKTDIESIDMEQLLAEAEELIQDISEEVLNEMQEEHRLQFELNAQKLKKIKSKVHGKMGEKGVSETSPIGDGMHEAILDIIKSMQDMAKHLT